MTEGILTAFVVFVIGLVWWNWHQKNQHIELYNGWAVACERAGGHIEKTRYNWDECFVDGKEKVLPGYEQYQKDKPQP